VIAIAIVIDLAAIAIANDRDHFRKTIAIATFAIDPPH
jgi:hypothetical protein